MRYRVILGCLVLVQIVARDRVCAATYEVVRGGGVVEHCGVEAVSSARFTSSSVDSVALVVVGSSSMWMVRPGGQFEHRMIGLPGGAGSAFGSAAAVVHNVNSTQFDAFVVGDPGFTQGRGRVSIYLGRPGFGSTPSLEIEGESAGDLFGASVADIEDVNGDGFGDFAVGAPGRASGSGAAYVFLGGTSPSTSPALSISGSPGALFGSSVAGLGDVNGDGFRDFLVGAPGGQGGGGAVSLFRGAATLSNVAAQVIPFPGSSMYGERPRFGAALAGGADFDRDGRPDFVVGAPGTARARGSAFLFRGTSGTIDAGIEIPGASAGDHFGAALLLDSLRFSSAIDLAVGSPGALEGRGSVTFYFGGSELDLSPHPGPSGGMPDDAFGWSLGSAQLFRQALVPQLLIGAPFADLGGQNAGAAFFYAAPPAVAVEQSLLVAESDGGPLQPNEYTTTRPRIVLRLEGASSVDVAGSEVYLDDARREVESLSNAGTASKGSVQVAVGDLAEGPHELRAQLHDAAHTMVGSIQIRFIAAARLRIDAAGVYPNPVPGSARLSFTLTRPAAYELHLYDVSGREIERQAPAIGIPGENVVRLGGSSRPRPGVYFFELRASYQDQQARTRGRVVFLR